MLQLVFAGFTHAGATAGGLVALRSASTNAPGGIAVWRNTSAVVTPLSFAVVQTGVLSDVTGSLVAPLTLLTVQSVAAVLPAPLPGVVRQTGSLYVTVTTFDATDMPV